MPQKPDRVGQDARAASPHSVFLSVPSETIGNRLADSTMLKMWSRHRGNRVPFPRALVSQVSKRSGACALLLEPRLLQVQARRRQVRIIEESRQWLIQCLEEHPCVDCGISDIRVLEFDHRDDVSKIAAVAVLA